jgi:hypothetical protein
MVSNGFEVDLEQLRRATSLLRDVYDGMTARDGRELCAGSAEYGHVGLAGAASTFGTRWGAGLSQMTDETSESAERLGATVDGYQEVDTQIADTLSRLDAG